MSAALQRFREMCIIPSLHRNAMVPHPLPARRIKCLLGIQMEVHVIHDHLEMALGLHVSAHDAERTYR